MKLNYFVGLKEYDVFIRYAVAADSTKPKKIKQFLAYLFFAAIAFVQNFLLFFVSDNLQSVFFPILLILPLLIVISGFASVSDLKYDVAERAISESKQRDKRYPLEAPVQLTMTENGITHEKYGISTFIPSTAITKLDIDEATTKWDIDGDLLYLHAMMVYIIPERAFQDAEQKGLFIQQIQEWLKINSN